ncbi:MAG TPA: hypothetical protein VMM35_05825 [Longimicrobiales bacterium]|nr:hypothetical protein [Longimicrobiales bacterium]
MKRLGILLITVLSGLVLVPAATADKPERFFLPSEDFVFSCPSFDVSIEFLENNEYSTVFSDGRFLITGKLKIRLTNLSDPGNSMDANISGPGVITETSDGGFQLTAWGIWLFWFFPGDLGPGSPGTMLLTKGLASATIDGTGNLASFTPARNTTSLCPALA